MGSITLLQTMKEYRTQDFGWVVLSFGAGVVALGILGVIATLDRSKCVVCLVTVTQFVTPLLALALAVIGAGVFALYLKGPVEDSLSSESRCLGESAFSDSQDAVVTANNLICTIMCPCKSTPALQASITATGSTKLLVQGSATAITKCSPCENLQQTLTIQQVPVVEKYLASLNLTMEKCQMQTSSDFEKRFFTNSELNTFPLLEWAEENFDCAGVCTAAPMYLFSDINRGTPTKSCRESLRNWIRDNLPIYGGITLGIGGWLLLAVCLALGLCCVRRGPAPLPPAPVPESNLISFDAK